MYELRGATVYVVYTSVHSVHCTVYSRVHGMVYNLHLQTVHKHCILYGYNGVQGCTGVYNLYFWYTVRIFYHVYAFVYV